MENDKQFQKLALEFYKKSITNSYNYPIDKIFIDSKLEILNKYEYLEFLIFSINNLPNIYVSRLILLTMDFLILFNLQDWIYLYKSLENVSSHNILSSFFISYLKLFPSADLLKITSFKYDYIYEKDDDDFVENNFLNSQLEYLRTKLLSLDFTPCDDV